MRFHRFFVLLGILSIVLQGTLQTQGAGFGLYEGSARGDAMGGSVIGSADDPSALFYNPAGITQLEGLQVMGGATIIKPQVDVTAMTPGGEMTTTSEENYWVPPHLYGTYQVNDRVWAGMGIFSRFGLGTEFDSEWVGRYNSYNAVIQTLSFNPDIAFKVNDKLSLAAGLQAMWFDLTLERRLPLVGDPQFKLTGDSVGYGWNTALRYQILDWVSFGAAYQSTVEQSIDGTADATYASTDASGDVKLPAMAFFGLAIDPVDNLTIEASSIYTGWSTYDELKINFDDPTVLGVSSSTTPKDWDDVWRYQIGVEYDLTDAWALRAGYVYDQSPVPESTADYLVPANDRHLYSIGCGYSWETMTLDLSYTYLSIEDRDIEGNILQGIYPSEFTDGDAHMVGISFSAQL